MGRMINLTIYCQNGKGHYKAYFEERLHGHWYGIRAEAMPNLSFFEKLSLKNSYIKRSSSSIGLKSFKIGSGSSNGNFTGQFFTGNLKCPSCGNSNFVIAVCGNSGEVKGTISDVSADSSGYSKRTSSGSKYDNKKR